MPPQLPAYPGNQTAHEREPLLPAHVLAHARRRQGMRRLARIIVAVLIGLGVCILLFMALHHSDNDQAHQAAEDFILTIQANDANKAYAMGAPAFRTATTEEKLGQMFDQVEPFIAQARIDEVDSYYAVSEKGEPRVIIVYTASKGQKVTYIRLVMDKQDKAWKVHSVLTNSQPLQAKPE
jgi:hypothetical protein